MGESAWPPKQPATRQRRAPGLGRISAVFDSPQAANSALQGLAGKSRDLTAVMGHGTTAFTDGFHSAFHTLTSEHNGHVITSASQRELSLYGHQSRIYHRDRVYLSERDETTIYVLERPAWDTWQCLPQHPDQAVTDFFDACTMLGWEPAAVAADALQARDGGSFVYIEATGRPDEPITGKRWTGFDVIPITNLVEKDPVIYDENSDPLLRQHGIEFLHIYANDRDRDQDIVTTIHGSRLVHFKEDVKSRSIVGRSRIDGIFNTLWDVRDILFSQRRTQMQGAPIVLEVDVENFDFHDEDADEFEAEMQEFEDGHRNAFSPLFGASLRRLDRASLDDPMPALVTSFSRISQGTRGLFPTNMLLASTRGSEKITDEDAIVYDSNIETRRRVFANPILMRLHQLGVVSGMLPRRPRAPPLTCRLLRWPHVRRLGEKEEALQYKNYTAIANMAYKSQKRAPWWIERLLPDNTVEFNPDLILPTQPQIIEDQTTGNDDEDQTPAPEDDDDN